MRGTFSFKPPARHLPLDGGGWEGVFMCTSLSAQNANDNFVRTHSNEEQSHG